MTSNENSRYQYTFDPHTGEPLGIIDTWYQPAYSAPPVMPPVRRSLSLSSRARAVVVLAAFAFACGFYSAVVLFGTSHKQPPLVVVCPPPPGAITPAECAPAPQPEEVPR